MTELAKKRPQFRYINAFKDLPGYRWPLAALVSGMHRASGLVMLFGRSRLKDAEKLYEEAAACTPADAMEKLDIEAAKAEID